MHGADHSTERGCSPPRRLASDVRAARPLKRANGLFKRVLESVAFWLAAFSGVQFAYFAFTAAAAARAYALHQTRTYAFGDLQAAEDALLRAVVWIWIMDWAETSAPPPASGALEE